MGTYPGKRGRIVLTSSRDDIILARSLYNRSVYAIRGLTTPIDWKGELSYERSSQHPFLYQHIPVSRQNDLLS